MPRPPPRISREVPRGNRKPNGRVRHAHEAFVRSIGICICCGRRGQIEVMHVRSGTDGGTGLKPSSRFTLPGCHECHMRQHAAGEQTHWAELGIDPLDVACRLWSVSGDLEQGVRAVERALAAISLHKRQDAAHA